MRARPQASLDDLILRAREGNDEAFGSLVEALLPELTRIAHRTVYSNRIDPDDILQESILHAMASIERLRRPTRSGFLAWFGGIARNRVLALKKGAIARDRPNKKTPYPWLMMEQVDPADIDQVDGPPARWIADGGTSPLEVPLRQLKPAFRVVWLLREVYALSWETMAELMEKPNNAAVRQMHYRAQRRLTAFPQSGRQA